MKTSLKISQEQIIDSLCQLVRIKRVSGNEHEAVEFFKKLFTQHLFRKADTFNGLCALVGKGFH